MTKKKVKKRLLNKFVQIFLSTFALLMVVVGIGTIFYVVVLGKTINFPSNISDFSKTDYSKVNDSEESIFGDKKLTTFAVFGVDKDNYRTDVTMIVFFHHETGKIDILSVPRDTKVKIPDEIYETIKERRSDVNQIVKINSVPSYVVEERNETSVAVLESNLGVDIDYYVNMQLDVFRFIVDTIGGVEVDVPMDMDWDDNAQDLHIHLKAGLQTVNGAQAEQLVRFRKGYANADVGRIDTQQVFMKAFIEQLLNTKNRLNMVNIVGAVLVKVDTNFENAVDYLMFLDRVKPENFTMHVLPRSEDDNGGAYYLFDYDATKVLLDQIVNQPYLDSPESDGSLVIDVQPEDIVDTQAMTISVQNGTRVSGLAGKVQTMLEEEGFNPIEAVDYDEKPVEVTKIYVPAQEAYEVLKTYFKESEMILAPGMMDDDIQVIIIVGDSES